MCSNMKIARIKKELTQTELAKKVNISHVTISRIEKGNIDCIKLGTLKAIANELCTTVQELFLEGDI